MVNVSRGAAVPSVFLVVVVAEAESITQTSEHGGKIQPYHFTPKGGFAEMGGTYSPGSRQEHESKGVARIGFFRGGSSDRPLDISRDNDYYWGRGAGFRLAPWSPAPLLTASGFSK